MKIDDIEIWTPADNIPQELYLESLQDRADELKIILAEEGNNAGQLIVTFPGYVAYQNTDATGRLRSLSKNEVLSTDWPLFIARKSSYIDWVIKESHGIVDGEGIIHYIITSTDRVIDVLCEDMPEVAWQKI